MLRLRSRTRCILIVVRQLSNNVRRPLPNKGKKLCEERVTRSWDILRKEPSTELLHQLNGNQSLVMCIHETCTIKYGSNTLAPLKSYTHLQVRGSFLTFTILSCLKNKGRLYKVTDIRIDQSLWYTQYYSLYWPRFNTTASKPIYEPSVLVGT